MPNIDCVHNSDLAMYGNEAKKKGCDCGGVGMYLGPACPPFPPFPPQPEPEPKKDSKEA